MIEGGELHRHRPLIGGVASLAAKYPPKMVSVVLRAHRRQLQADGEINSIDEIAGPVSEMPEEYKEILESGGGFWDDVNGGFLPAGAVLAARREEVAWVRSEGVYVPVPEQEAIDAGIRPLDLLWVDTDKSHDPKEPKVRSRLCVREFKTKQGGKVQRALPASQLFSAMPPLESIKCLVSYVVSVRTSRFGRPLKLRHYDISRAHFMGKAQRLIYERLPEEDRVLHPGCVGETLEEHVRHTGCEPHMAAGLCGFALQPGRHFQARQALRRALLQLCLRHEDGSAWR